MKYVSNALSLKMLNSDNIKQTLKIERSSYDELKTKNNEEELISAIGHSQIANILEMPLNRTNILLEKNDIIYIVQGFKDSLEELTYRKITVG